MTKAKESSSDEKVVALNKRARHDYHILEIFEAGVVLTGGEIKSVRAGEINLAQSFVSPSGRELFLLGAHIRQYSFDKALEYNPIRKRKLLLKRIEIAKLINRVERAGLTIVPLRVYIKRGHAKVEIALAKGKSAPDKRDTQRSKEAQREMQRAVKTKGQS